MWSVLRKPDEAESDEFAALETARRADFLQRAVRGLMILVKDFTFDLSELQAERVRGQIDDFLEKLGGEYPLPRLEDRYKTCELSIHEFAQHERSYLVEREQEFREIIETLCDGLLKAGAENRTFCESMEQYGQELEQAARLDDLRKIKQVLSTQVASLKKDIKAKRRRDAKELEKLQTKMERLHLELRDAVDASLMDPLTGVGNRRAFDSELARRLERGVIQWRNFALIIVDVDNFKKINDSYGHLAGDRVLSILGERFKSSVRSEDMVARYGGEELVIILEGANLRAAMRRARELVRSIDRLSFSLDSGQEITVTISAGVAAARPDDSAGAFLDRADQALYLAKQWGKNQAVGEHRLQGRSALGALAHLLI
ncbi:MAG: diguanylate cyclase [Vulcanimicrobiota bacterium]